MASKLVIKGKQLTGAVVNALKINCKDKDGKKSTVQAELNKLNTEVSEQNKNLEDIGEAVLLAEITHNTSKTFDNIDITPYRQIMYVGYKYANNTHSYICPTYLPTSLVTVNTSINARANIGGTPNAYFLTRLADKSFKLTAEGADNYGARFYGIK